MSILQATRRSLFSGLSIRALASYLLRDLFAGTNGTNLTAHTMNTGPGWTQLSGGFTLNGSGQAVPTGAGVCLDVASAGQSDMDVSATVQASALTPIAGIALRVQDASNYFQAILDFSGNGYGFSLFEISGGAAFQRAFFSISPSTGTPYTLRCSAKGTLFTGYLNGVSEWTYTSSDFQTQQNAGLRNNLATAMVYSNFQVVAP